MKIPDPIMTPTTSMVASNNPRDRENGFVSVVEAGPIFTSLAKNGAPGINF
jgi:hypothetical protein